MDNPSPLTHRFSIFLASSCVLSFTAATVASAAPEMLPTEIISAPADPDPQPTSPIDQVYFGRVLALDGNRALFASVTSSVAYIYSKRHDGWDYRARLVMPPGYTAAATTAELADDIAVIGVNDPSFTTKLVVFQRRASGWTLVQTLPNGLVVKDGHTFVISDATGVGLYESGSHGLQLRTHIDKPADTVDFGASLSLDGDTLFVGAPFSGNAGGNVYVYERHGHHWQLTQQLNASDPQFSFGSAVDVTGRLAVVGAYAADADNSSQVLRGAAYVFRKVGGTWFEEQKLTNPTNGEFANFVVGTDGTHLYLDGHYIHLESDGLRKTHAIVFAYRRVEGVWTMERELVPPTESNNFALHYAVARCGLLTGDAYVPTPDPIFDGEAYLYELGGCRHK